MPTFFLLIIIFLLWLTYERKKASKASKKEANKFWERERSSGYVPKKSTDDVVFITVPEDIIPDDPSITEETAVLRRLTTEQSADLSAFSNTDLRLKYGTGNFDALSAADANYTELSSALGSAALKLAEAGNTDASLQLIRFADEYGIRNGDLLCAQAVMCAGREDIGGIEDLIDQALEDPAYGASGPYIAERLRTILNNMLKQ